MTGDTTPISDEAMMADIRLCLASYGFIAANQAEFLLAEVARLSTALLLVSAEAERLREQRDNADMSANALAAVVEGLRAELAERDAELAHLFAQLRHAVQVDEWRVPPKDTAEIVSVAMETLAKHWDCGDDL